MLRLLLVPLLLVPLGCNPGDYEQRMFDAQALMKQRDDEYRVLGSPITLPPTKTGRVPVIFIRLPLGINPMPENKDDPVGGLLYQFARKKTAEPPVQPPMQPGGPPPMPPGQPGMKPRLDREDPALVDVFIAYRFVSGSEQLTGFVTDVMKLFPQPTLEPVKKSRRLQPLGREPFDLDVYEFGDATSDHLMAVETSPQTFFAVVYRFRKGKLPAAMPALNMSLGTIALDDVAMKVRPGYINDSIRRPPQPPQ